MRLPDVNGYLSICPFHLLRRLLGTVVSRSRFVVSATACSFPTTTLVRRRTERQVSAYSIWPCAAVARHHRIVALSVTFVQPSRPRSSSQPRRLRFHLHQLPKAVRRSRRRRSGLRLRLWSTRGYSVARGHLGRCSDGYANCEPLCSLLQPGPKIPSTCGCHGYVTFLSEGGNLGLRIGQVLLCCVAL
jgi:hypothetical protein